MYNRKVFQWILLWVVVVVIGFGHRYPLLGFSVPIVMVSAILFSTFKGRFFCGNFCPRGSFFDRFFDKISLSKNLLLLTRKTSGFAGLFLCY